MVKLLKIGIVGCGAIGSSLAKFVKERLKGMAELAALYDIEIEKAVKLSKKIFKKNDFTAYSLDELIDKSELVIECAGASSSWNIAKQALTKKRDIMIMSVGGILTHFKELSFLSNKHNSRVYIPSGAICGIDGLKALSLTKIKKVVLTTIKNPRSFKGVQFVEKRGIKLKGLTRDKLLFSGNAVEAVKYFPQNINVAAVLSLSGIGAKKTYVKIIASPSTHKNIHRIEIDSAAGTISTCVKNVLHPENPKTSFLAVLSAMAVLRQILEPVKIGT